jgi:hypothetical protein
MGDVWVEITVRQRGSLTLFGSGGREGEYIKACTGEIRTAILWWEMKSLGTEGA